MKKVVFITFINAAKMLLFRPAAKVLPFFLLAVLNLHGQDFGPDYLLNYWAPANARVLGMGKGSAALHAEGIAVMLVGANFRDFDALTMSYGSSSNTFPDMPDSKTTHFAVGASINNKVLLAVNNYTFESGTFYYQDEFEDTLSDNIVQKNFSANLGFKTKSDVVFAFNADFLNIQGVSVRALGFSIGGDSKLVDSETNKLTLGFSAGLNGVNAFFQEVLNLNGKIAPEKVAMAFSADYTYLPISKWVGNAKFGIEYQNYLNYSNLKLFRTGLEVELLQYLFVRGGYYIDDVQGDGKLQDFTSGMGLILPFDKWFRLEKELELRIDGAFLPYPDFGEVLDEIAMQGQTSPAGKATIISATFRAQL